MRVVVSARCTRPGGCLCGTPLAACVFAEVATSTAPDPLRVAATEAVEVLSRIIREHQWLMTDGARTALILTRNKLKEALGND